MRFQILLCLVLWFAALPVSGDDARQWLDRSHQAAGGPAWDDVAGVRSRFKVILPGLEGEAESLVDVRRGRFADRATLGALSFSDGFDGTVRWERDTSGQVKPNDSPADQEETANQRYLRQYAHWYPGRWPAEISDLGEQAQDGRAFQRIAITPDGGRRFVLWIDVDSGLIDRMVENDGRRDTTTTFSDYREVDGRKVAHATTFSTGDPRYDQHTTLIDITFNPPFEEAELAMPTSDAPDYRFANQEGQTTVPFELINNHTYVDVRINGDGPFRMILDTGGVNVITPRVAARLGLESQGELEVGGVGESSQTTSLAQVDRVELGEVGVDEQLFLVIDFDQLSQAEGVEVEGLVGYEIFRRFLVRLDYQHSTLTLADPKRQGYQGQGVPVRFAFDGRTPVVDGAVDGIPGKLTFDTGSRNHVSLHAPFVEEHGLMERHPEGVDGINGWGVGGPSRSRVIRGTSLRIGDSIEIAEPIMSLSLQERGAMTNRYQIANLGAGILSRFNLVFDYAAQTIWFETHPGTRRADQYDRSGVWINDVGEVFEIMGVVPGGPAHESGLQPGDRILRIDEHATSEMMLADVRERWRRQRAGSTVTLEVDRGGERLEVRMVLRDLIPPPRNLGLAGQ